MTKLLTASILILATSFGIAQGAAAQPAMVVAGADVDAGCRSAVVGSLNDAGFDVSTQTLDAVPEGLAIDAATSLVTLAAHGFSDAELSELVDPQLGIITGFSDLLAQLELLRKMDLGSTPPALGITSAKDMT